MLRWPRAIPLLVGVLLAAGCGDESDPAGPEPDGGGNGGPAGLTDPAEVVAAVAKAWSDLDYTAMESVLAPDFKFWIRDDEAADFPWLATPWWGRTEELGFAANMFDPNFTGQNPPVQSITFQYTVLSSSEPEPGTHSLKVDAIVTVLTGPADGWSSDTRFDLQVKEQTDGFLLLSEMKEVLKLEPGRKAGPFRETSTWGQIKGLYK